MVVDIDAPAIITARGQIHEIQEKGLMAVHPHN